MYQRKWLSKNGNKQRNRATSIAFHNRNKEWLDGVLGGPICVYCRQTNRGWLQYEHRNAGGTKELKEGKCGSANQLYSRWFRNGKITEDEIRSRLQLACDWCNYIKGRRTDEEFRQLVHSGKIMEYAERLKKFCPHNSDGGSKS